MFAISEKVYWTSKTKPRWGFDSYCGQAVFQLYEYTQRIEIKHLSYSWCDTSHGFTDLIKCRCSSVPPQVQDIASNCMPCKLNLTIQLNRVKSEKIQYVQPSVFRRQNFSGRISPSWNQAF